MDTKSLPPYRDYPTEKSDAGPDLLPTYTPSTSTPTRSAAAAASRFSPRTKKLVAGAAGALLFLSCFGRPLRHEVSRIFGSEFREGWGYAFGGEGFDWQHHAGGDLDEADVDDAFNRDYLSLATSPLSLSVAGNALVPFAESAREIIIDVDESVAATLYFTQNETPSLTIEQVYVDETAAEEEEEEETDVVQLLNGDDGEFGLIVGPTSNPRSYIINVALPIAGAGKPISFSAHGALLSIPAVDLSGHKFRNFVVSSSSVSNVAISNLNAHSGRISVASGGISGSFNVSRELILKTGIGAIDANVSIFTPPWHHHHHNHTHNFTQAEIMELDESERPKEMERPQGHRHGHHDHSQEDNHDVERERPGPPPPRGPPKGPKGPKGPPPGGRRPHHPPPPPHRRPHGGPPGLVKVFAGTGVGAINLLYTDSSISNHTTLVSKARASIGAVKVGVLPGFKGLMLEGSHIGEVSFANPGNTTIKVVKEVHHGPGGFIKAFVGPPPPHHHHGNHTGPPPHKKPCHGKKPKKDEHKHESEDKEKRHARHHGREREEMTFEGEQEMEGEMVDGPEGPPPPSLPPPHKGPGGPPPPPPHKGPGGPPPPHKGPGGPPPPPPPPHKGPGGPPPPPHKGPGGPPPPPPPPHKGPGGPPPPKGPGGPPHKGPGGPHHGPPPHHPPPGYGLVAAFAGTGKVEVVFL